MMFAPCMPFAVTVADEKGSNYLPIESAFFDGLIADILHFFATGEKSFDGAQTLEVIKIREGAIQAKSKVGVWVKI